MNIAIDIQPLVSSTKIRGIGVYTIELIRAMIKAEDKNEYFLFNIYGDCEIDDEEFPKNVHKFKMYSGKDNYLLSHAKPMGKTICYDSSYEGVLKGIYSNFIKENKIDLFIISSPFDFWMCYKSEWFENTKTAVIFYDLVPYLFEEYYFDNDFGKDIYMRNLEFVKNCDIIMPISKSAGEDIIKIGADRSKVEVIYSGVGDFFHKVLYTPEQIKSVLDKYGIEGKFLVFPGSEDFRKNVRGTVEAFCRTSDSIKNAYQLVITGGASDKYKKDIADICAKYKLPQNRVIVTGHIPGEDLLLFYNVADMIVFTSIYEGFGLPIIEAYSCGTPVVTSNNSSLGEVAEGSAVLVDPYDIDDIARGIEKSLTEFDFSQYTDIVKEKLSMYTWEKTARLVLDAAKKYEHGFVEDVKEDLNYIFFAPENFKDKMQPNANIFFEKREISEGTLPVYILTDNRESVYMLDMLKAHSGVCVLLDENYARLFYEYCVVCHNDYVELAQTISGDIKDAYSVSLFLKHSGEGGFGILKDRSIFGFIVKNAEKIITFSEKTAKLLKNKYFVFDAECLKKEDSYEEKIGEILTEENVDKLNMGVIKKIYGDVIINMAPEKAKEEIGKISETLAYAVK